MTYLSIDAILLAAVANIIIGLLWYGPLFGNYWKQLAGISEQKLNQDQGMSQEAGFAIINALVIAGMLDATNTALTINNWLSGGLLAAAISVGFVFTTHANRVLWQDQPAKLYMLDMAHYTVSFFVMGALTAAL